jgi:hypothetical protein
MPSKEELTKLTVSFYDNVRVPKRLDMSVGRILNGIRRCAYGKVINDARVCLKKGDKDGYDRQKESLPAVTFCGTFNFGHRAEECNHYNCLLVIDIDKLEEDEMEKTKSILAEDPYVSAFWTSPSGNGFKGLVHLQYDERLFSYDIKDRHKMAFKQVFKYLLSEYAIELDKSGSDISRLCFMSADKHLTVKEYAKSFFVEMPTIIEDKIKNGRGNKATIIKHIAANDWNHIYGKATNYKFNKQNREQLLYLLRKLKKRKLSITDSWENWVKVAFAIASSVHPEKGRELFLNFCRLDGARHDEAKSEHLIWDAYRNNQGKCTLSTIIYLARQKGVVLDR